MKTTKTNIPAQLINVATHQAYETITELSHLPGRVYVHLTTSELARQFMQQAEAEGFSFADGIKPTKREAPNIIAVNPDHTINYVGTIGRIAFSSNAKTVGGKPLIRVDYQGAYANIISFE